MSRREDGKPETRCETRYRDLQAGGYGATVWVDSDGEPLSTCPICGEACELVAGSAS